jgi:uncharacterized membrane-anchored protein YitT (DUF2179 family)
MEFMRSLRTRIDLTKIWQLSRQMIVLIIGALLASLGYALFLVPFNIAAGGVSGISIIINSFTGWPFGLLFLVLNIPLLALGFYYLGRWRFLGRTVVAVLIFSFAADFFIANLPKWLDQYPLTDDVLLSAIYGGIIGGIGSGLIYRSGGTMAGTGIVGRIWQRKTGVPLSQTYLYTNGIIILTAGLVFGWGVRTVTIITDRPKEMGLALIEGLNRSVSRWEITGMYTGKSHDMLICTVYRPQVAELKRIVADIDQEAFVVIGTAHQAWGYGFSRLKDAVAD